MNATADTFPALPGKLLLILGSLMALVAVFTAVDAQRRTTLEIITEPSALGDERPFNLEGQFKPGDEVVRLQGQPLFRAKGGFSNKKDWLMERIGLEDSGRWFIYRELERDEGEEMAYFLRVGPRQYVVLTPVAR